MSAVNMNLKFNEADMARFRSNLRRYQTELAKTPREALRVGVLTYLTSVRASTKQAPKRRKVRVSQKARRTRVTDKLGNVKRIFVVEALDRKTGQTSNIPIFARTLAEAKEDPRAIIRKWGLAKKSWGWMMRKLYGQMLGGEVNPAAVVKPSMVSATSRFDFDTGYSEAVLENKLEYMPSALSGSRLAVSTALERANKSMESKIAMAVDKATREAGY